MSKPKHVFEATLEGGDKLVVIARHRKGALSVVNFHGYAVATNDHGPMITLIDDKEAPRAINHKDKG